MIASGSWDKTMRVYNFDPVKDCVTLKFKVSSAHSGSVVSLSFSKDNSRLVSGSSDTSLKVWSCNGEGGDVMGNSIDLDSSTENPRLIKRIEKVRELSRRNPNAGRIRIRLVHFANYSCSNPPPPQAHEDWVFCCVHAPNGKMMASSGRDQAVRLWDTRDDKYEMMYKFTSIHTDTVRHVVFIYPMQQLHCYCE